MNPRTRRTSDLCVKSFGRKQTRTDGRIACHVSSIQNVIVHQQSCLEKSYSWQRVLMWKGINSVEHTHCRNACYQQSHFFSTHQTNGLTQSVST
jgi:hypothetical protein